MQNENLVYFYVFSTVFILLLVILLFVYIYLYQQKVNKFAIQLRDQELLKQKELFKALNEGEENERKRLAEELHDGIGAKISGLKMSLEYLIGLSNENSAAEAKEILDKINLGMNETIEELREISHNMKPALLTHKGLKIVLEDWMEHFNRNENCYYKLYFDIDENKHEAFLQLIYRIVSELMNNIRKHAMADTAFVQILEDENNIQLIVEDNGKGFDYKNKDGKGIGLQNLESRINYFNGKMHIDSSAGGTTIIIELPISNGKSN